MRRIAVLAMVALMVTVLPVAVGAQTDEEVAALLLLRDKVDELGGETAEEWADGLAAVEAALADLDAIAGELDTAELAAAVEALGTAVEGGDLDEMAAAGDAVAAALAALEAEAEAGETPEGGVSTGAGGTAGSDMVLLVVFGAALTALGLAGFYSLKRRNQN